MTNDDPSPVGHDGRPPEGTRAGSGAARRPARHASRWPKWLRRGPLEMAACIVIALGIFMMLQPFALVLYTWSFVTTLFGVAMFTIVSKFPK
jgi:hypothetical protein